MDKTAQAARQARLAQALRTNLRRRKAADAPTPETSATLEPNEAASSEASEADPTA